ncbi:hypothetical protein [Arthrobacter bussei]|uniref:hypothetical protein n=1 Tax=Arthrobacter bussei TaxID=2594179 RepID=UPI00177F0D9E|nr:hypothetical protein [Arthrobacter bussei]
MSPVPPSPEDRTAAKAVRDLRTINIALYAASLLLVAAGGLFIGAAVPGPARAVTICAVVALFYAGGLILHAQLPRLRPAAVAFAGTGLALLPVAGLLFGVLTGEGPLAWFGTALIGTVAYLLAAVRLQSRVVAYLSLPFFLSIALSSVSLIGGALIWYFTCSIGVAALFAVLAHPAPRWMPEVLTRAVLDAHRVLTPLALAASLLLGSLLAPSDRALLWVVAAVHYGALLVFVPVLRILHFYATRLVATLAAVFIMAALDLPFFWAVMVLALCTALQVAGALVLAAPLRRLLTPGATPPSDHTGAVADDARTPDGPGGAPHADASGGAHAPDGPGGARGTAAPAASHSATGPGSAEAYSVVASPSIASPSVASPSIASPSIASPSFASPSVASPSLAGPASTASVSRKVDPEERARARYRWDVLGTFALTALAAAVVASPLRGAGSDGPDVLIPVLLVLALGMWIAERFGGAAEVLVLPGILLAVTAPVESPWRTEVVLVLSVGYLLLRARASADILRERFLLAARAGGVLLLPVAVMVHLRLLELPDAGLEELAVLAVVLGAVANQLAEVVRTRAMRATLYSPWVICTSSVLSLVAALVAAAGSGLGVVAAVAIWSTVAAGLLTTLVLPLVDESTTTQPPGGPVTQQGGPRATRPVLQGWYVEAAGPVSLLVAAFASAAAGFGYRTFEVLLACAVVHGGLTARRAIDHRRRGAYLLAAQIAFTALTALVSRDLDLTVHGVLTVVAVGIALQEIVRVIIRRRLRALGLQSSSAWLSTAALAALPLAYSVLAGPTVQLGVIVVHLALLLVVSVILFTVQHRTAAAYPALYALAASIAVLAGVLETAPQGWLTRAPLAMWVGALLAAACLLALVVLGSRSGEKSRRLPVRVGAGLFALEAGLLSFADGGWDRVLVAAVVAGALFVFSRVDRLPWLDAVAALAVIVLATVFVEEVTLGMGGLPGSALMRLLIGAVLAAGLLYLARDLLAMDDHGELRYRILGTTALCWAAVAALAATVPQQEAVAGSVVLGAVAVLTVREVPVQRRPVTAELAFLVLVAAAQRIAWVVSGGITFFWAAQWWAVAFAVLAAYSFLRGSARRGPVWLSAAAVVLSGTGLLTITGGTAGTQVWALCGHVLLLAAGVALSRRLFSLWGAVGIVLALLWFLRGYTFLLLTVAALALLAFAVWKLNTQTRGSEAPASVPPGPVVVPARDDGGGDPVRPGSGQAAPDAVQPAGRPGRELDA